MPLTVEPLPDQAVWELPVADTRSPLSTVLLRGGGGGDGGEGLAIDACLAADFPMLELKTDRFLPVRLQVGLMAGAFMQFGAGGELTFDLQTFDGVFGFPVDLRWGPWSVRAEWVHISAHYGDGIRKTGVHPANLDPYSRELVGLMGSREFTVPGVLRARAYLGGRSLVHSLPAAAPLSVQVGGELSGTGRLVPYLAVDVQIAGEFASSPALTGQVGGWLTEGQSRFRLALAARTGPDETGKSAGEREQWVGLLVGFDRTGGLRVDL